MVFSILCHGSFSGTLSPARCSRCGRRRSPWTTHSWWRTSLESVESRLRFLSSPLPRYGVRSFRCMGSHHFRVVAKWSYSCNWKEGEGFDSVWNEKQLLAASSKIHNKFGNPLKGITLRRRKILLKQGQIWSNPAVGYWQNCKWFDTKIY